jgi:hypothetical protein
VPFVVVFTGLVADVAAGSRAAERADSAAAGNRRPDRTADRGTADRADRLTTTAAASQSKPGRQRHQHCHVPNHMGLLVKNAKNWG